MFSIKENKKDKNIPDINQKSRDIIEKSLLNKKNVISYVKKALIYWIISIAGLLFLYQLLPEIKLLATVIFVILFAVTAPHTWVMHRMKN